MRRLKHVIACFLLLLLCQVAVPPRAQAQVLVEDILNWIENALQVIQQAYEIYQKYQQLYNDYQRYATMIKNLEQFDELTFRNLVGLTYAVNDIMQYGYSLGHTLYDLDAQFAETFPGYEPILQSDWLEPSSTATGARSTPCDTPSVPSTGSPTRASRPKRFSSAWRATRPPPTATSRRSSRPTSSCTTRGASSAKISQQLSVQTNAQAVYWAYQVDREASDRATTSEWITNGVAEVPPYDGAAGAHGVPAEWPWPCLNCGQAAAGGGR